MDVVSNSLMLTDMPRELLEASVGLLDLESAKNLLYVCKAMQPLKNYVWVRTAIKFGYMHQEILGLCGKDRLVRKLPFFKIT
jgi:hypothetical protein